MRVGAWPAHQSGSSASGGLMGSEFIWEGLRVMTRKPFVEPVFVVFVSLLAIVAALGGVVSAEGSSGCPNRTMVGFQPSLPDCRAYEMVTPPYKEGFQFTTSEISEDGSQVLLESLGNLLTPEGKTPAGTGSLTHAYRLSRGEAGWESVPVEAPFATFPDVEVKSLSPDFGTSIWSASAPGESSADIYFASADGPVRMGPAAPPGVLESSLRFVGGSEDLRHALFFVHSAKPGLEEEHLWPGDTTNPDRRPSLYEYAGTGLSEPSLVGVRNQTSLREAAKLEGKTYINQAAELISNCGTVLGSFPEGDTYNAVGADGETVFFTSEECGGTPPVNEVYARIGGEMTIAISEPSMSVPGRDCTTEECM